LSEASGTAAAGQDQELSLALLLKADINVKEV
jgi:hypothetical protein